MLSPVTHAATTPAAVARSSIGRATSGLVANATASGTPASRRRSSLLVHLQFAIQQDLPVLPRIREEDADLAVRDASGRPTVLALHAD
jgi:hypothetical protein